MKEYCGNHFILNGEIKNVEAFDNSLVIKGESIYEVIRLHKGIPVFFDDHMERLVSSVNNQKKRLMADTGELKKSILKLAEKEKRKEINIKIVFNYNEDSENFLVYYIESNYPTPEQYKKGVKGILFWAERNDPQAKVLNYRLRSAIHQELVNEAAYEALLVNSDNLITEGSKSNVFFVNGEGLVTAPDDCILKGVTRKQIIDICDVEKIDLRFDCVNADDISGYDAVFITGTSPMVLPYCCINDEYFNVKHPLMERLRRIYLERVEVSLHKF
ncbi:MAG: aminotransferase class IV [Methanosarcina sp.]